ncbi:hypothetical protein E1193_00515 [Micromonospora sp. KC606]|uniref:hypothetical protein n=1 Tax=Micromonospora sp. KC606 TaxID=2530379 RepID=UPI001053305A|nr:hypothetical protein [Micromonospora sp. KC606]TDC86183.1 hypothetical protein E1193_00515 [Micromonospora sp. KC606]
MSIFGRFRMPGLLGVFAVVAAIASLLLAVLPGPAQAATTADSTVRPHGIVPAHVKVYTLISSVPTFNVAEGRSVINALDAPVTTTFTSNQSRTYTVSTSTGHQASFFNFLTVSVSQNATLSRTTALGVSATTVMPPRTRVLAEYGIEAFDIVYDVQGYTCLGSNCRTCPVNCNKNGGPTREARNVPTVIEGWRLTSTPA